MASKLKHTSLQHFSEEKLIKWRKELQNVAKGSQATSTGGQSVNVEQIFEEVFQAHNQQEQLKAIKKIRPFLQQPASSGSDDSSSCRDMLNTSLRILTEIHSLCNSRHPLQRAIVSLFQGLSETEQEGVLKIVSVTIARVFYGGNQPDCATSCNEYSTTVGRKVEYLEALMENFKLGEAALKQQLPTVLKYCVSAILSLSNGKSSSHSMGLLLAVLKATINLMHKLATIIGEMLSSESNDIHKLNWPGELKEGTPLERSKWTSKQLSDLEASSENLLVEVDSIPHDASVAAAMLLFVIFNINHSSSSPSCQSRSPSSPIDPDSVLCSKLHHWFSHLKPFGQLAVCHGALAKLPPSLLLTTQVEEKPLLVTLFPRVCKLFDSFTETSDRYLASRTMALWTTVARDCTQMNPSPTTSVLYRYVLPSGEIMQKLLQLVWSLWEDPIDGIRHQCRDMFENAVKIYQQLQKSGGPEDYLMTLAKDLLSLESPTRGKFILLSSLSQHLPADKFLLASPQLPLELLSVMGHQALACHAGDLWTSLVSRHWKEVNGKTESGEKIWNQTWVNPLVVAMCTAAPPARQHIVQHCLPALFQCSVNCMQYITSHLHSLESVSADGKLIAHLACLRCARMECKEFDAAAATGSFADLFSTAMHHTDEQIRLSALGLLCESHRTTEPPLPSHLKLLFHFIELNANSQSPGFRYPTLTAFKKLFIRIRDSSYAMLKLHQKGRGENPEPQITSFQNFLRELMTQQFAVLHPFSSFQRRSFSLSLLQLMASIFDEPNSSAASNPTSSTSSRDSTTSTIPSVFNFSSAVSPFQAKCLLDGLQDAFDANRSVCLELLLKLPAEMIGFTDLVFVRRQAAAYLRLVQSPKSVSCSTAAFQLKLFLQKCCLLFGDCLATLLDQNETEQNRGRPPFFVVLTLLCKLLNQHISEAKKDLVSSSMSSPMYGVIQSIRAAYECLGTAAATYARDCRHHREAMATIVSICHDVAELVSPVVCTSSPEGFLPDREGEKEPYLTEDSFSPVESRGNAQSLLLCCWHSMKEIALLLGYLTEYAPVISDAMSVEQEGVITHGQLDTIAKIFIHQLTEARHRGAFEMAYSGFSKLCRCLWSNSSPVLNQKPQKWVKDLLESLQSTSMARLLSITRRSAGLPFYLQAILTAEPAHTGRVCLKSTMETLLRVARECPEKTTTTAAVADTPATCSSGLETAQQSTTSISPSSSPSSPTNDPSQPAAVHALNILRALYRDSRLGEHIVPFIPEGVMIAIEGFSAPLWPVRNSSTLLFSALVTRIFGAKRVQDEHSMENKMTAKEFFTRFPTLHLFLLKQLEEGVGQMGTSKEDSLQPSLFPVLLLLSRLYPSPLDEANSPISMKPFLPLLISCTCCSVWKTRVLVAHTITSMITEQNAHCLLGDLYGRMDMTNQNGLHGLLLVVEMVVRDRPKLLKCISCMEGEECSLETYLLAQHLCKKELTSRQNLCGITNCLYLKVLLNLLEKSSKSKSDLDRTQFGQLGEILADCYQAIQASCHLNQQLFDKDLNIVRLRLLLLCSSCDLFANLTVIDDTNLLEPVGLLKMCICDGYPLALRTFCLEFINTAAAPTMFSDDIISEGVFKSLCSESDPDYLIQAYGFASCPSVIRKRMSDESLQEVIDGAYQLNLHPCNRLELRISLIRFLSSALSCVGPNISSKYLGGLVSHLEAVCVPTQPYEIRVAVARELAQLWSAILSSSSKKEVISTCCQLVLNLLQDSDIDVRTHMAVSVAKILPAGVELSIESPNPSSALECFIKSIPKMISDLDLALSMLLHLVPGDVMITSSSGPSNPLFDEDPINEYAEDVVLLQHIAGCLSDILSKHKELPIQDLITDYLNPEPNNVIEELVESSLSLSDAGSSLSVWENPKLFMMLVRRHLSQGVLGTAGSSGGREEKHIGSILVHPIFL